ncbi:pyridoxamine 5'-phosphate oxidase family protein [Blastochloris tepida]|uniref:Flavin-nucleotide-binding protein n=1 Tax=Blastochloris tepida TaxID=2233851 RepID=A0A348FXA3_9HYPH|nr:pyridoxamine 5'-phosphate oxidase family protein [Blastochloris tepida]BBF91936.1 flavin-nucleotide-binding protein [Blastochloris tepida]
MTTTPPSERTRVRRYNWLARYDRDTIIAILDAMPHCHIGYIADGQPFATPTLHWREGDRLYWHGSTASRMIRAIEGAEICLTVSAIDGLVMARSAFNFNVNHRSVMVFGRPEKITDPAAKEAHLRTMVNRLVPGQWERLRPMKPNELEATAVMSMPFDEASAKVRVGPPEDDEADYALPVWAGVIPVRTEVLPPEPDPRNLPGVEMPAEVLTFRL